MLQRLTVAFVGDSFVAGVGDLGGAGWTGRLIASSRRPGLDLTGYPLGVRRNTSVDVAARWEAEVVARVADAGPTAMVLSFGVNDAVAGPDGRRRVPADVTVATLDAILARADALGLPTLVVGPPPIDDPVVTVRVVELDTLLRASASTAGVPYVSVVHELLADPAWTDEVRAGDGAHPGAAGYAALAAVVRPRWDDWLAELEHRR
ncbi:DUF459 domain-containing protein [Cellulomonas xylanilytica]|uniref:SGNH hydrolase-type esterase domain-containing protein n=1 Tax=Cellulomonas xylanilytica TaxID=233583 RepID=A0A510V6E9_9CELL|nr:GDSL-type esterase/lipase family protein [Cellulomonas xylanilytica]GEK22429.1 hypothetical protein CXY01_29490 [Cellulomonas xylanilytica]